MTSLPRLAANVGTAAALQARELVVQGGQKWLDVGESRWDAVQVAQAVRAELARTAYAGVVLVGGLDVVPADRLSVLDPQLRRRVEELNRRTGGRGDSDDFIVWNDDLYGDRDGDGKVENGQADRRAGAT